MKDFGFKTLLDACKDSINLYYKRKNVNGRLSECSYYFWKFSFMFVMIYDLHAQVVYSATILCNFKYSKSVSSKTE